MQVPLLVHLTFQRVVLLDCSCPWNKVPFFKWGLSSSVKLKRWFPRIIQGGKEKLTSNGDTGPVCLLRQLLSNKCCTQTLVFKGTLSLKCSLHLGIMTNISVSQSYNTVLQWFRMPVSQLYAHPGYAIPLPALFQSLFHAERVGQCQWGSCTRNLGKQTKALCLWGTLNCSNWEFLLSIYCYGNLWKDCG